MCEGFAKTLCHSDLYFIYHKNNNYFFETINCKFVSNEIIYNLGHACE